ncbi:MAG: DNA-processing protein DprA [Candidatus Eremiobacteraeota bacterium]|nr:DNA-processing protein DprA [Candidatus Eremiobacteraeota bacterium]
MDDRRIWLSLAQAQGVGPSRILALVSHFGSPGKLRGASLNEIKQVRGIGSHTAEIIARAIDGSDCSASAGRLLNDLERLGIGLVTYEDDIYPPLLRTINDPPLVLYMKGTLKEEDTRSLAVVGARKASDYGKKAAAIIAGDLACNDFTVVSGLARGIDSCAHRGALDRGGRTIGVLGCGPDIFYPPENARLQREMESHGAVLSEFPPGTKPEKGNFPLRNRIIAGMTMGTLVVEADLRSGSLITAGLALSMGREVFAVPGSILSALSRGTHGLIREGAKLVERVGDILEEFNITPKEEELQGVLLTGEEKHVLKLIGDGGKTANELMELLDEEPQQLLARLTVMEVRGIIRKTCGTTYMRKK